MPNGGGVKSVRGSVTKHGAVSLLSKGPHVLFLKQGDDSNTHTKKQNS